MAIYIIAIVVIAVFILVMILTPLIARINFRLNRPESGGVRRIFMAGTIVFALNLLVGGGDVLLLRCVAAQPALSNASPQCAPGSLKIDGSSALAPLVQLVAKDYTRQCPGTQIQVSASNSGQGRQEVEDGSNGVMIGNSDVPATADESDLVDHQVAVVIFCVIINANVGVTSLSTGDLKDIYSGRITNWSQVGGPDLPIKVFSRPEGSGTRTTFQQYVLGGPEGITTARPSATTDAIDAAVAGAPGAIGYATLYEAENAETGVRVISIDNAFPSAATIENNSYHFWNIEHMYTKPGHTSPLADDFLAYMSSSQASAIARAHSFLSTTDIRDNMFLEVSHCS